jgi:hypothetical protein
LKVNDLSEGHVSIFRVKEYAKKEPSMDQVASRAEQRRAKQSRVELSFLPASRWFLANIRRKYSHESCHKFKSVKVYRVQAARALNASHIQQTAILFWKFVMKFYDSLC